MNLDEHSVLCGMSLVALVLVVDEKEKKIKFNFWLSILRNIRLFPSQHPPPNRRRQHYHDIATIWMNLTQERNSECRNYWYPRAASLRLQEENNVTVSRPPLRKNCPIPDHFLLIALGNVVSHPDISSEDSMISIRQGNGNATPQAQNWRIEVGTKKTDIPEGHQDYLYIDVTDATAASTCVVISPSAPIACNETLSYNH
ncbi:hypothetical protein EDD85DRAFT_1005429 [Armillaria nabsnona]|nr:hypothetical protein EDD85DRAFT_1005429 [Armillaria nabsnona]